MTISTFLIDDHPLILDGLAALLKLEVNIDVLGASSNYQEAVKDVKRLKPDVVVMEFSTPNEYGFGIIRQILYDNPATRILILSPHEDVINVSQTLQAGALGYLPIDISGSQFVSAIHKIAQGNQVLSDTIKPYLVNGKLEVITDPLSKLRKRERQVMNLLLDGHKVSEIAVTLQLSVKTIETYRYRVLEKLELNDLGCLIKYAMRRGLID